MPIFYRIGNSLEFPCEITSSRSESRKRPCSLFYKHCKNSNHKNSNNHYKNYNRIYSRQSRIAVFILILLILPVLTGCKKRQDIVLDVEMDSGSPDDMQKMEGAEEALGSDEATDSLQPAENTAAPESEPALIYVHICGAVLNPGVYELPAGSRVFSGIEAAGGLSEDAYGDYVNQAETLQDGQKLVIPTTDEIEAAKADGTFEQLWVNNTTAGNEAGEAASSTNGGGKININTASESELQGITGIGATRAAAIVQYRNEHGSFGSIEDIMQVSGIKEGTYEKIKDEITVN